MTNCIPRLRCEGLTFSYGGDRPTLRDLSLAIDAGEAVLLMGPSGCGKSTLAYCLAGLYPEYAGGLSGHIDMDGAPLSELTPDIRARKVSMLFQNPDDQFCMDRVDREILFALENIGYVGDMEARVNELLGLVGLAGCGGALIHTLSGGTKQKVALATALATGPEVLILDEPFANIDPDASAEIAATLARLHRETGLTLLIVDHRMKYWRPFVSRILVMDGKGGLAADFPPGELPRHRALFDKLGLFFEEPWPMCPPSGSNAGEAAITARGLSVHYGTKRVLDGVDLCVPKGSMTAITGRNGSGKTTLLWALAGLTKYRGHLETPPRVGLVFQNPGYQFLTQRVRDEVLLSLQVAAPQRPEAELHTAANSLLAEFGLERYADASPYTLSQGQQRRLAVLAMTAGGQDVLLLDEPTYAQDARATRFIMDKLSERVAAGLTLLFSTHDLGLAYAYADAVIALADGQAREEVHSHAQAQSRL